MLISLRIENFAIVASLELDFQAGMTAFTGETGAGKSIMIDALMLAFGGRADASVIRAGAAKCDITAQFHVSESTEPLRWLMDNDIPHEDGEIYLRRLIYPEGRSKSYINGQLLPQQKIKELSEMLVDIHGQHQHQRLLQHATHRQQLDQYADHQDLLDEVSRLYHLCQQMKATLELDQKQERSVEGLALLEYQLAELDNLAPKHGEVESLHAEHQLLHHALEYISSIQDITALLNSDEQPSIYHQLTLVAHKISQLPQDCAQVKNAGELIQSALIQCEEALDEIETFATHVQLDPERLQIVEERMSNLHQAARKYHVETGYLPELLDTLQKKCLNAHAAEQQKQQMLLEYQQQMDKYQQAAYKLRESRMRHAQSLADSISATIQQLGMPKGYITIQITPLDKMHVHGMDKVEYHVCTNPGMLPDTLNKVASGGEISRISLAIQMITAKQASTPTLLFDEVDVGIGGATAALVGKLLRNLGERLQLFCVTHQPQVASCAHHHLRVEKYIDNQQTYSQVTSLAESEKIDEIARMLGGLIITEQTRSHARELLLQSHV